MKLMRLVLAAFLLPGFNCTPMEFKDVTKATEATGLYLDDGAGTSQQLSGKSVKESIIGDWDAMHESLRSLEEEAMEIDVTKFKGNQLNIIMGEIENLNICHNLLEHILGTPASHLENYLINTERIWKNQSKKSWDSFKKSIWNLVLNIQNKFNSKIPNGLHHLQVDSNDCLLQTIQFVCKYNLAPNSEFKQNIQEIFRSRESVELFIQACRFYFRKYSKYDNEFSFETYSEKHLKYHFRLQYLNNLYQEFSKKQKDWILFQFLRVRLDFDEDEEMENDLRLGSGWEGVINRSNQIFQFLRKLKSFLSQELEDDNRGDSIQKFLVDVRDDLIQMRKIIIEPVNVKMINHHILGIDLKFYLILEFLHDQFGFDYVNSGIFGEEDAEFRMELRRKSNILKLGFEVETWKDIILDYNHVLAVKKTKDTNRMKKEEERKEFYWKKLKSTLAAYKIEKIKQFEHNQGWKEKLERNQFYKNLIQVLDLDANDIPKLHSALNAIKGSGNQFSISS